MVKGFGALTGAVFFAVLLAANLQAQELGLSRSEIRGVSRYIDGSDRLEKAATRYAAKVSAQSAKLEVRSGINRNTADFDLDGDIDDVDKAFFTFCQLAGRMISVCYRADFNHDGVVNLTDTGIFATYWVASNGGNHLPGDFDLDLDVDEDDAAFFRDCYGRKSDGQALPDICAAADLNRDGVLNLSDVAIMTVNQRNY